MENREKIEKKVFSYIEEHSMLKPADKVVVGVSGGADSVCLFLLLWEYAKRVPLELNVVHVNHGIREEAGEDARFVEELCRERGVSYFLVEENVRELAIREGYSEEDAGRRVRYDAFFNTSERLGGARIAVAHNSNDNAETMLFHLFRGSGIQGLSGISPVRGDIIRPILCLERREVEAYLESVSARWCQDVTNEGDDYRRNRIRHHILSYVEEEVVFGAVRHMGRTAELLRETADYLEMQTQAALRECVEVFSEDIGAARFAVAGVVPERQAEVMPDRGADYFFVDNMTECLPKAQEGAGEVPGRCELENTGSGSCAAAGEEVPGRESADVYAKGHTSEYMPDQSVYRINIECFNRNHTVLQKRMLLKLLNRLSPTGKDISAVHVMDALKLFEREGNRNICFPFGIRARRQYGSVFLERREEGFVSGKASGTVNECLRTGTAEQSGKEMINHAGEKGAGEEHLRESSFVEAGLPGMGRAVRNSAASNIWQERAVDVSLGDEIFRSTSVYDLGDWGKIEFTGFFTKKGREVPIKRYTKWFDYDKIKECVVIRSRCQGDYLTIADGRGNMIRKSVKNYMITEKIPRQIRDEIPVVAVGSHVVWLAGWRISEAFKVSENTERILQIRLLGAEFCEDGETEEKDGGEH